MREMSETVHSFLGYGCSIDHNQVNIGSVMVHVSEVSKYAEINYPAEYAMKLPV